MVQSFTTVTNQLQSFADNHLSVARFQTSFFEQLPNFSTEENNFPILFAQPNDVTFLENVDTYSFRVYCLDILQKDRSNEPAVLNNTLLVLRDLNNWLRLTESTDLYLVNDPRPTPVNNALMDYTCGWYADFEIGGEALSSDCAIPFSENFIYTGTSCTYDQVVPWLTCATLAACSTFSDLVAAVAAISGGTDTYVTGGTANDSTKEYTFTNSTGGTFNVIGLTDIFVTGGTYDNGTAEFINNTGGTFSISGFTGGTSSTSGSDNVVIQTTIATTAALAGSPVYDNGTSGSGATLTRATNGALAAIDGRTLIVGDRILVKNQSSTLQNGVYEVTTVGSASVKYVLTRTTDADSTVELDDLTVVPSFGTVNKGLLFAQQTNNPTVGTSAIVFTQTTGVYVSQISSGTQVANQIPVYTSTARQLTKGTNAFTYNPTTNVFTINSVAYTFPSTNGSGRLTNNGSGILSWNNSDLVVTGGTYSAGTATFTNNTGGTFNVSGFLTGGTSSTAISSLTPATATNTINNSGFTQEWQWNSLTSGSGLKLSSSSTGATGNTQTVFEVVQTGTSVNTYQTTYAARFSNLKTDNLSTQYAAKFTTTGDGGAAIETENLGGFGVPVALRIGNFARIKWSNEAYILSRFDNHLQISTAASGKLEFITGSVQGVGFGMASIARDVTIGYQNSTKSCIVFGGDNTNTNGNNYRSVPGSTTLGIIERSADSLKFSANAGLTGNVAFVPTYQLNIVGSTNNVGIGTISPAASAKLDVTSTTQGFLPPRMTTIQKDAISAPATGLVLFDTDLNALTYKNSSSWVTVGGSSISSLLSATTANTITNNAFVQTWNWSGLGANVRGLVLGGTDISVNGLTVGTGRNSNTLNTAFGFQALTNNSATVNTAIGYNASRANTGGVENVAVGALALDENQNGGQNTATGVYALQKNTTSDNTAFGYAALNNTTGNKNTAVGARAGQRNSTGVENVFIGNGALFAGSNRAVNYNTLIGSNTSIILTSDNNTSLGYNTFAAKTSGGSNIAIGANAASQVTTCANSVFIGSSTALSHATKDNIILLSDGSGNERMMIESDGRVGIGTTTPAASAKLDLTSTTQGFLPPRMTALQAEAISTPAEGLMIYSTDGTGVTITSKGWWGYDGSTWVKIG